MLAIAVAAAGALGDVPREGLRVAAVIAALFMVPALCVVIATAALLAALLSVVPRAGPVVVVGGLPAVPPEHLAVMLQVSAETGVPWELLAAIASVESGFGANMSTSSAGAIGYGQFLPSSWEAFGQGGDPYDYRDAIPAMARYLRRRRVESDLPNAVWGYNHSWEYVALVLERAVHYGATESVAPLLPRPTSSLAPAGSTS